MNRYLFVLGRTHELCFAELQAILKRFALEATIESIAFPLVLIATKGEFPVDTMLNHLGGTIKIAQVLGSITTLESEELVKIFNENVPDGATFGLSNYSNRTISIPKLAATIKTQLGVLGKSTRY